MSTDPEEIAEELLHQRKVIHELRRRKHRLEIAKAQQGNRTPPEVLNEIEDLDKEIGDLEEKVAQLEARRSNTSDEILQLPQAADFDKLEAYFTDVEDLRELFKKSAAAPDLPRRLLIIHGVGGVGKSSLLRMFYLYCKSIRLPTAIVSGDETKSAVDMLAVWADGLRNFGLALPGFTKTFKNYRIIQTNIEEQAKRDQGNQKIAVGHFGRANATNTADNTSTFTSTRPITSMLGGVGTEAFVDWLSNFLNRPDIDLLLNPGKDLKNEFLIDVNKLASSQRLVLMFDAFEQMTALENWICDLLQHLHPNIFLVIAGRVIPDWSRQWHGWLAQAELQELKPMSEEIMRELISRYYAEIKGGIPDPVQVAAITSFARGLPIVVTSAVRLWIQYGVEEFQVVKSQVVADLADRLMEGVPTWLMPAIEAVVVLRWFDRDILRAVLNQDDISAVYNEMRHLPFIRPRIEGFSLHETVREVLDENLRSYDRRRYLELHSRAKLCFDNLLMKASDRDTEKIRAELLYHWLQSEEDTGITFFQEQAEDLVRNKMVNRLRVLLNDVNTYRLERESSRLWREYYNARLLHLEENTIAAEKTYQSIIDSKETDSKLHAYVLCDYGELLASRKRLVEGGDLAAKRALSIINRSLSHQIDTKLISNYWNLGDIYRRLGDIQLASSYYDRVLNYFEDNGDIYTIFRLKVRFAADMSYYGAFIYGIKIHRELFGNVIESKQPGLLPDHMEVDFLESAAFLMTCIGNYKETRESLELALQKLNKMKLERGEYWFKEREWQIERYVGYLFGLEGQLEPSKTHFDAVLDSIRNVAKDWRMANPEWPEGTTLGLYGAAVFNCGKLEEAEELLLKSLDIKQNTGDMIGIPELLVWMGQINEIKSMNLSGSDANQILSIAESYYERCLSLEGTDRRYFKCVACVGLVRVKYRQKIYGAIPTRLADAEQDAQKHEYNDQLASLRLIQGHIAWDGHVLEWESGFDSAFRYYQHAMIFSLRYNRFMLDKVLQANTNTNLQPQIISYCQQRGTEGQKMLVALREWWQSGLNDVGVQRLDTVSLVPEGISLVQAEIIARSREPGDGSQQHFVIQQLDSAIEAF
jgi:tetratricopeptide (TPR) repeat protein